MMRDVRRGRKGVRFEGGEGRGSKKSRALKVVTDELPK